MNKYLIILISWLFLLNSCGNKTTEDGTNNGANITDKPPNTQNTSEDQENLNKQLIEASKDNQVTLVQQLLEQKADPNTKNNSNWTPLMFAANKGHSEVVNLLLDKGADPNARDNQGWTVVIWAASKGHTKIVNQLIEKGGDPTLKNNSGETALDKAKKNGHTETVNLLEQKLATG